jgi:hypothetical protein
MRAPYQTAAGVERDLQRCLAEWDHQFALMTSRWASTAAESREIVRARARGRKARRLAYPWHTLTQAVETYHKKENQKEETRQPEWPPYR